MKKQQKTAHPENCLSRPLDNLARKRNGVELSNVQVESEVNSAFNHSELVPV